jgi:tRNA A-37 threonylcarbamoyl transferase component Bud32
MGVVYKARHLKLNRLVALKMLRAGRDADAEEVARLQTEAEVVARLQHPNVVQIFEVGEWEGRPFLAMEFCPGGSLEKRLTGTPLAAREAAQLVEALARAVEAAHQARVLHRDLKPGNVLLDAQGTPKVTDFGLAKKLDDQGHTQSGAILGTASYMAPEQASGRSKQVGPAADVYALGAILYECLTGRPPFKGDNLLETLEQVRTRHPVAPRRLQAGVPTDLEVICLKCLQKDMTARYASAGELAADLRRFLAGQPVQAPGWWRGPLRWARRHRFAAVVAVGGVVASLLLLLGAWLGLFRVDANRFQDRPTSEGQLAVHKPPAPPEGKDFREPPDNLPPGGDEPKLPDLYVLSIGIAKYKDENLQLNYAASDARKIGATFKAKSKALFREIKVRELTDEKATRKEILAGLEWLGKEVTQRDYAVVFFSGHGDLDGEGDFYLLPVDVDPKSLLTTGVSGSDLRKQLAALPGKVLLLLDACHPGRIDGGKRKPLRSLTDDLVRDLTAEAHVVVMCSSIGRQFSLENNRYRAGNFTVALVEGLSGKADKGANGAVYLHHLDAYVTDRVKELSKGKQHPVTSKPSTVRAFPIARP